MGQVRPAKITDSLKNSHFLSLISGHRAEDIGRRGIGNRLILLFTGLPVSPLFYFTTRILVTRASGLLNPSLPVVENTR